MNRALLGLAALGLMAASSVGCTGRRARSAGAGDGPGGPGSAAGWIVVAQAAPGGCKVELDGRAWPEGGAVGARMRVQPGMHEAVCRGAAGVAFQRKLEVAAGRETPLYWGP